MKDVQLTATLPLSFTRDESRQAGAAGTGDVELGVKYRFLNDEQQRPFSGGLPARHPADVERRSHGAKTRLLLPLWVGKDFAGGTSLFGGGGYEINPGPGNRNFWQAGVGADPRCQQDSLSLGAEITRQGSDSVGDVAKPRGHRRRSSSCRTIMRCSSRAGRPGPTIAPAIISMRRSGSTSKARRPARGSCRAPVLAARLPTAGASVAEGR